METQGIKRLREVSIYDMMIFVVLCVFIEDST